ncbi:hypothetical protein AB0H12_31205 [Actinosynnema sp. NPDC023794]
MMVAQNNHVVFAAIRDQLWSDLEATCDVVLEGDDHAAALAARTQLPGLIAGLRAPVAQHTPDANGYYRQCRTRRWWRRIPALCHALVKFRLTRDDSIDHRLRGR